MSSRASPAVHHPHRGPGRSRTNLTTPGFRPTPANRRFTPYRKTPATRRLHNDVQIKFPRKTQQASAKKPVAKKSEENVSHSQIVEMLNKTWKAHKLSPLHRFSYNVKDLKSYGRQLASYITADSRKGEPLSPEDIPYKTTFSVLRGIKQTDNDEEAVRISLKGENDKEILVAVLCSVNIDTSYVSRPELREFTALPLLLVKGSATLTKCLTSWIQVQFDSKVSKLALSSLSLSWMLAMWSGFHAAESRTKRPIRLVYTLPKDIVGLGRIIYDIDAADCLQLWQCVHPPENSESSEITFLEEEMTHFVKSLEQHFYSCMKIKLGKLHLSQIGTSAAFVDSDGRIKLYTLSHCLKILAHLTQLSAEQILDIP